MALIDAFYKDEITIFPFIRMANGGPVYGDAQVRRCRLQHGSNLKVVYKDPDGTMDEKVASAVAFCGGDPIPVRSEVQFMGESFIVIKCSPKSGFAFSHLEVYLE